MVGFILRRFLLPDIDVVTLMAEKTSFVSWMVCYYSFIISRASFLQLLQLFFTSSNSFLNTQNICSSMFWAVSRNFIRQLLLLLRIYVQFVTAICIKYCAKCKCNKKKFYKTLSLILFSLMVWKRAIWRISCVSMLSIWRNSWFAS